MGDSLQNHSSTNSQKASFHPPVIGKPILLEGPASSQVGKEVQEFPLFPPDSVPHPLYRNWQSNVRVSSKKVLAYSKREKWTNKVEFIMVSLSVAVGLGNVWRFPFTAYENGGGAFLIPYLTVKILVAQPLYFLELTVGQFCSQSPVGMWDSVPLLRGVGWAIVAVSTLTGLYYVNILAICAVYIVYGFQRKLPWGICDEKLFRSYSKDSYIFRDNFAHFKCQSTYNNKTKTTDVYGEYYPNPRNTSYGVTRIHTTELFYQYVVTQAKDHIEDGIGAPTWEMSVALLFVWILIFINMSLGTKSSGKGAYFTALFPYLVLFLLLARACFLDGSKDGILFLLRPDFAKLLDVHVWYEAMSQAFFSLGIGYGSVVVCGSYNPLHQATYKDALVIAAFDTFTSLLAGLTVFAILGGLSMTTGKRMKDVVKIGPGLAFVSFPELMLHFGEPPWPQILSFLFFSMLIVLGIGSSASVVHVISATLLDRFPSLSNKQWYKVVLVCCICIILYFSGLIFCTPGGPWMVKIFDHFGAGFIVFLLVMFETAGIAYFYGMKNFERDIMFMFPNYKCTINCKIFRYWGYMLPVLFVFIIVYIFINMEPITLIVFEREFQLPAWGEAVGWSMFAAIIGIIPVYAVYIFLTRRTRSWYKKWMASVTPTRYWGPQIPEEKLEWVEFKRNYDGSSLLWRNTIGKLSQPPDPEITSVQSEMETEEGADASSSSVSNVDTDNEPLIRPEDISSPY